MNRIVFPVSIVLASLVTQFAHGGALPASAPAQTVLEANRLIDLAEGLESEEAVSHYVATLGPRLKGRR